WLAGLGRDMPLARHSPGRDAVLGLNFDRTAALKQRRTDLAHHLLAGEATETGRVGFGAGDLHHWPLACMTKARISNSWAMLISRTASASLRTSVTPAAPSIRNRSPPGPGSPTQSPTAA